MKCPSCGKKMQLYLRLVNGDEWDEAEAWATFQCRYVGPRGGECKHYGRTYNIPELDDRYKIEEWLMRNYNGDGEG